MARDDFNFDEDDEGNKTVTLSADDAIALRDRARKASEAEATASERDEAKRKLAFYESGIDMKADIAELFVKGYDGDLTAEAIKEAAAKYPGLIPSDASTEGEQLTPEQEAAAKAEAEQTAARQQLASGNSNAGVIPDRDPRELAAEAVQNARKQGWSEERALSEGLTQLVNAAAAGDTRVRIKGFGTE